MVYALFRTLGTTSICWALLYLLPNLPWQYPLPTHSLRELIITKRASKGMVSTLYSYLLEASYKALPVDRLWRGDVPGLDQDFDWDKVWANFRLSSRNPEHQQIHCNFIHSTYLTPWKLHFMKVINDPSCTLKTPDTFLHMMWECPPAYDLISVIVKWSFCT